MKDSIKAREAFHVKKVINIITGEEGYRIDDGYEPIFVAEKRTYEDYMDEKRQNEMFRFCEVFTTAKGNQYIYWRDDEINADYITKAPKEVFE